MNDRKYQIPEKYQITVNIGDRSKTFSTTISLEIDRYDFSILQNYYDLDYDKAWKRLIDLLDEFDFPWDWYVHHIKFCSTIIRYRPGTAIPWGK